MSNFCYISVRGCNLAPSARVPNYYNLLQTVKAPPGRSWGVIWKGRRICVTLQKVKALYNYETKKTTYRVVRYVPGKYCPGF